MKKMWEYRIGVLADTHGTWKPQIATLFEEVDEIWHLGDVCHEEILDELRVICPKVEVVLGNNDFTLRYPLTRTLERHGETFYLIHIPPAPPAWPPDVDWILFGHTHRPENSRTGRVNLFNPGSAGRANKGAPLSVGFLTKQKHQTYEASVVLL